MNRNDGSCSNAPGTAHAITTANIAQRSICVISLRSSMWPPNIRGNTYESVLIVVGSRKVMCANLYHILLNPF